MLNTDRALINSNGDPHAEDYQTFWRARFSPSAPVPTRPSASKTFRRGKSSPEGGNTQLHRRILRCRRDQPEARLIEKTVGQIVSAVQTS